MKPATSKATTSNTYSNVKELYSEAAKTPQAELCCPKDYAKDWTTHIPAEALDFNYGCGSPILKAGLKAGEIVVDLGSGVGIDCFVAAKLVGPTGKVYGIDMTDDMLAKARNYQRQVAGNLGYDVISFLSGRIEEIPLPDRSVDVLVSNCVINLSPDKGKVFSEIRRVLKDGGRVVIADIVADREVDEDSRNDGKLWAECYTGALSVSNFIQAFGHAGFEALAQLAESPWTEVNGYRFASLTLCGYNYLKGETCEYQGRMAIYLGPYATVTDEEGHEFARFSPVEICSDTARRLNKDPYRESFLVTHPIRRTKPEQPTNGNSCCAPSNEDGDASGCCDSSGSASGSCC